MRKKIHPDPVLLFIGLLYKDFEIFPVASTHLKHHFGDSLFISPKIPWDHSDYYRDEIGWPLFRQFIFFRSPVDPGTLTDIKNQTNKVESMLSKDGKRQINLDPGYLSPWNIVLASTKNYAHRIYLGKGIYGEVTLVFRKNSYTSHLFTYFDYRSSACIKMFNDMREHLRAMQKTIQ